MYAILNNDNSVCTLLDKSPVPVSIVDGEWVECAYKDAIAIKDFDRNSIYMINQFIAVEILTIHKVPEDFEGGKYLYTKELGLSLNSNYVKYYSPDERIEMLEEQSKLFSLSKAESELEIDERISKLELGLA